MNTEDIKFLNEVAKRSQDPTMMRSIINSALGGCEHNARQASKQAADMEVVASMALNTRLFKGNEKFLADKLESWKHRTALRWDDQIEELRKKAKK
jgi:hypothetical protein